MTWLADPRPRALLRRLSSGVLFYTMMGVAAAGALALSLSMVDRAARSDRAEMERTQTRLLSVLRDDGLSGLSFQLDVLDRAGLPGWENFDLVLWRLAGGGWKQHRATSERIAGALASPPETPDTLRRIGGDSYRILTPDIAALSRGWTLPMGDVALSLAFRQPGQEMRTARDVSIAVWSGLALAFLVGSFLMANHKRRYRDGLREMNQLLERFSTGETGLRIPETTPAPELRELARRLNRVLPLIDELVSGLRYFSANMAHELKTPLQLIRNDLSRMRTARTPAARAELADGIDRTIDQANARIHSLMQFFRLEAGADIPMRRALDLSDLAEVAVDDMLDVLERDDRRVRIEIAPGLRVRGNRSLLDLMISNLLTNAAKYAPPGAEISVSLAGDPQGRRFRLTVANSGGGFPRDVRARAFERFSRARSDDQVPGTGIGLSLIRAIADRHGFEVSISPSDDIAEVVITGAQAQQTGARSGAQGASGAQSAAGGR